MNELQELRQLVRELYAQGDAMCAVLDRIAGDECGDMRVVGELFGDAMAAIDSWDSMRRPEWVPAAPNGGDTSG